jgi:hypothetical protein
MAAVSGLGTTSNLPNFVGELFRLVPQDTPFKNLAAANGIRRVLSKQFTWQTTDNATAAQPDGLLEGADPTYAERDRAEISNVVQIFQYGVQMAYSKLGNVQMLGSGGDTVATPAVSVLGNQPVANEIELQQSLKLDRCAEDMEVSMLSGTFQNPNDNVTGRKMRGIQTAITTNVVAAGSTDLSQDLIDELLRTMYGNRARFIRPVLMGPALQIQRVNAAYKFDPMSRTVGGVNLRTIVTPFGELGVVINRHMTSSTVAVFDFAFIKPVVMPIPGKGELFIEPLAQTGSALNSQLYGEWGLEYGPEVFHGEITGLTTT